MDYRLAASPVNYAGDPVLAKNREMPAGISRVSPGFESVGRMEAKYIGPKSKYVWNEEEIEFEKDVWRSITFKQARKLKSMSGWNVIFDMREVSEDMGYNRRKYAQTW